MHVDLSSEQRDLLLQLVDEALRGIGPEIRHTDHRAYRDDLREQRRELWSVRELLGGPAAPSSEPESEGLIGTP